MYVYSIFMNSAFGIIPLAPMAALLHLLLLKKDKKKNFAACIPHIAAAHVFCFVLLSILSATGISSARVSGFDARINLIPLIDLHTNSAQYMQNIVLFLPMGFLLPMLWKPFERKRLTCICGLIFSLSIELLQLFNHRATDVDDLLMNTLGTIVGSLLFQVIKKRFPKFSAFSADCSNHWKWEPYSYFVFAYFTMFFLQPFLAGRLLGILF